MIATDIFGQEYEVHLPDQIILNRFKNAKYWIDTKCGVLILEEIKGKYNGTRYYVDGISYSGTFTNSYSELEYFYKKNRKNVQLSLF